MDHDFLILFDLLLYAGNKHVDQSHTSFINFSSWMLPEKRKKDIRVCFTAKAWVMINDTLQEILQDMSDVSENWHDLMQKLWQMLD